MPTFWFWPNVDIGSDSVSKAIRVYREKYMLNNFHFYKNFEPDDFLKLINNSKCLIGNSSVGIRESSFLGVPVVNIGNRQNRRLKGENVRNCEYNRKDIIDSIHFHLNNNHKYESENIYGDGSSSKKIVEILATWEMTFHKTITY
jgi:UDP-N-acetylglucosamine 2-epimerase